MKRRVTYLVVILKPKDRQALEELLLEWAQLKQDEERQRETQQVTWN